MSAINYNAQGDAVSFVGRDAVDVYAMAVLASALWLYATTGKRANRGYTPKRMMEAATRHTGQTFKARDYIGAANALSALVQKRKAELS